MFFSLILLSIFLIILNTYKFENRQTLAESFLFTNLLTTIIPPRLVFSGNQFAYFDEHFVDDLLFKSDVYSSNIPYVGFSYLSKVLLWTQNLENLNSFLFFLNCFVFYGIFSMFKLINSNLKTNNLFYLSLFFMFIAINLPSNFNSLLGIPKLLLNGTAWFWLFWYKSFYARIIRPFDVYTNEVLLSKKINQCDIYRDINFFISLLLVCYSVYFSFKLSTFRERKRSTIFISFLFSQLAFLIIFQI